MVVPAGRSAAIAHTVVHEYGHHVDWSRRHSNLDEPNGTPLWWKARGMAELVSLRSVRDRYQIGWNRSIAEVFAEDYAFTNLRRGYRISWLRPPSQIVQQAIRADLGLAERPVIAAARPDLRPVVIVRQGTLRPREGVAVDFGLLGPNRSVRLDGAFPAGRSWARRGDVRRRDTPAPPPHRSASGRDARAAARRPGAVPGVDREHGLAGRAVPLHRAADGTALNARRRRTNSASRSNVGLRLNSSASRHA